jgi:hypothetical protein
MIVKWNHLEEWLWRMDQLRQMVRVRREASPLRCASPAGQRSDGLPSAVGHEMGSDEREQDATDRYTGGHGRTWRPSRSPSPRCRGRTTSTTGVAFGWWPRRPDHQAAAV